MPEKNQAALDFLLARRSRPAKTLGRPVPDRAALAPILEAGARTPDHGMLVPFRFVVLKDAALKRIAGLVRARGAALGIEAEKIEKSALTYTQGGLAVAVIASPKPSEKIPAIEQLYCAGAVCLSLLNAALASGWGANWISGWASHDADFAAQAFGAAPGESVAGLIFIGTETSAPPERARPELDAITTWISA